MNDSLIRLTFHKNILRRYHLDSNTRIVDELGLHHGESRADIAVINGFLAGYEIKSDLDSLDRLEEQVKAYDAIFDKITIIVGLRHLKNITSYVPSSWGIISAIRTSDDSVKFNVIRKCERNVNIQPLSIARLLWRTEVVELLMRKNFSPSLLRKPRECLYEILVDVISLNTLRKSVREILKNRQNWRDQEVLSLYDDLSRPLAK